MTTVYDKAKYHDTSVEEFGLPSSHAEHHTAFFLRWLAERDLLNDDFLSDCAELVASVKHGRTRPHAPYEWCDRCLVDDMLSDEGNAFATFYFDFDRGHYLKDYAATLQGKLQSEFHVPYSEENYQLIRVVIERRFAEWRAASAQ